MEQQVKNQSPETIPVAWQHNKALGACMIELYDKSLWTDVKFHCKDHDENERLHAHKIVLAARSPVFQAMFFGPCARADGKDEVELENAETKIMDLFLRYIYSDTVDLDEETAYSVLKMAHFYQVTNLVQFCGDYLATILTTENACGILQLAILYQVTSLRDACCSIIDQNANEILNSESFLELPEECLRYIIKGDTFFAEENKIFIKAEEWSTRKIRQNNMEKNGQTIRKALSETFYHLRLPTMSIPTLMENTRRKGYFSADEYEDIIDFINKETDASVKSNSCVARLPAEEELTLNTENETSEVKSISTSFKISVLRDLKLTYIVFTKIKQFLTCRHNYTPKNLLNDFDVVISSCLTITRHKGSVGLEEKELSHTENEDNNKEHFDDEGDDRDVKNLIFDQDFTLHSSSMSDIIKALKEPVTLTKAASPYTVKLTMHYNGSSNVKMIASYSDSIQTVTSNFGQVQVENIEGNFAGIKSLGFENFSNRDTV